MRAALNEAEKQLHAHEDIDSKRSGCTVNIGAVIPSSSDAFTLYSLNVGDSECYMSIQKSHHIVEDRNINIIHSPLLPEEKCRIEKCNGTVSEHNIAPYLPHVPRVFANKECTRGGLAMSRSIGDQLIHRYGVISEPTDETVVFSREKPFRRHAAAAVPLRRIAIGP
ncbi:hypothetical protein WA577_002727 [Blastocystis sp. JDR]